MGHLACLVAQTSATVVLSSTWRLEEASLEEARCHLAKWGIIVHDVTPGHCSRPEEIAAWLRMHRETIGSFVVLDDQKLVGQILRCKHCIRVDGMKGLMNNDVNRAVSLLKTVDGAEVDSVLAAVDGLHAVREAKSSDFEMESCNGIPKSGMKKGKKEKKESRTNSRKDEDGNEKESLKVEYKEEAEREETGNGKAKTRAKKNKKEKSRKDQHIRDE